MSGHTKLLVPIEPGGTTELEQLALRCGTTAKMLGKLAVRQIFIAARAEALPTLPPLDPGIAGGLGLWLNEADRAALDALADGQGTTPSALASLAVRHMLAQARNGALPMLRPMEEAAPAQCQSIEKLAFDRNGWSVDHIGDPENTEDDDIAWAVSANFAKATFTVERLARFATEGVDPNDPRAPLHEIERLKTTPPVSG